jgi:hypothetical protein
MHVYLYKLVVRRELSGIYDYCLLTAAGLLSTMILKSLLNGSENIPALRQQREEHVSTSP